MQPRQCEAEAAFTGFHALKRARYTVTKPDHLGHRKRLRERFLDAGGRGLADYEMLELLLFTAIPRADTKPVARALMKRFGSFAGVLRAEQDELNSVNGVGEAASTALLAIAECAIRLAREELLDRPLLGSWDSVIDYLRMTMAQEKKEQFRVLFLDSRNAMIGDEVQHTGTVNHTSAYPREIMKRALELNATSIILVHNHPSGDPKPSQSDIDMTRDINDAAQRMGIVLHDHVIVAKSGVSSFKSQGLL